MAFAPANQVEGPTYGTRRYGLFSQLSTRPEGDGRWQTGFGWETACGAADLLIPDCDPDQAQGFPKEPNGQTSYPEGLTPFTVYGYQQCSPVDRGTDRINSLAAASLQRQEERAVEAALWQLIGPGLVESVPADGPTDLGGIFGHVEALNDEVYAGGGLVLVSRRLAQWALDAGALRHVTSSTIGTQLDTATVAGNFDTTGGVGQDGTLEPTGEWVALIGPIIGYRSNIFYPTGRDGDLLDRGFNEMHAVAERTYALGVEPPCTDEDPVPTGYVFDLTYGE